MINISKIDRHSMGIHDFIVVMVAFITLSFFSLSISSTSDNWIWSKWDDADYLGVAYNLFHGKGFTISYIEQDVIFLDDPLDKLQCYSKIERAYDHAGPLYVILLGVWLWLTSSAPPFWYVSGAIFSLILSYVFLLVNYYWIRRFFGFGIAACSIFALGMLPPVFWSATRIRTEVLAFIFMVFTLYFSVNTRKTRDAIFLGALTGLGNLTHPIGVVSGVSLIIFFLMKRSLRKLAFLVTSWIVVLLPWIIRNQLVFGDYTLGLLIPDIFRFFSGNSYEGVKNLPKYPISPFLTYYGLSRELNNLYSMGLTSITVAALGLIGFLRWSKMLEQIQSPKLSQNDVIRLYGDLRLVSSIFVIVSLFAYYYLALVTGRVIPEARFIFHMFYILMPTSFLGLPSGRITIMIKKKRMVVKNLNLILTILLFIFVFVPSSFISVVKINGYQSRMAESQEDKVMHIWINENIPKNANIASNGATPLYLRTGLSTVFIHPELANNLTYMQWMIEKFKVNYVVFYRMKSHLTSLVNNKLLLEVYSNNQNSILMISPLSSITWRESDVNWTSFWASGEGGSLGIYTPPEWVQYNGNKFLNVPIVKGNYSAIYLSHVPFDEPLDLSNTRYMLVPFIGKSDGGTIRIYLSSYNDSIGRSYYYYDVTDDFKGLRTTVFILEKPSGSEGDPNLGSVDKIIICFFGIDPEQRQIGPISFEG